MWRLTYFIGADDQADADATGHEYSRNKPPKRLRQSTAVSLAQDLTWQAIVGLFSAEPSGLDVPGVGRESLGRRSEWSEVPLP